MAEKTGVARPQEIPEKKLRNDVEGREDLAVGIEVEAREGLPESRKKEGASGSVDRFLAAIGEKDLAVAYLELRGLRFLQRKYDELKEDFIELIDYYLAQKDSELIEKYRADLELIRDFVQRNRLDYLTMEQGMLEQLSAFGQVRAMRQLEVKAEKVKREVVANRFHILMNDPEMDPYAIFFQLVKAKELKFPEFSEWKKQFLSRLNMEIAQDDRDLLRATKLHLLSFRQHLPEL